MTSSRGHLNTFKGTETRSMPKEWSLVKLSDISQVITGSTPSTKEKRYWNGTIPFITPSDLKGGPIRTVVRTITQEGLQVSRPLPPGAVLVSCIGYIGKVGVVQVSVAVTNQQINAVIPDQSVADNWYVAFALMHLRPDLNSRARVTTVPILNKSNFQKTPIPLPPLPEQRRIAQVLSTIQEAIAAQEDVIAAARETKRSLTQRLFTYGPGAELVPTKETEIGEIPADWTLIPVGELAHVKGGKRLPKGHTFAKEATDYPYIRVVDFEDHSVNKGDLRFLVPEDYERIHRYTISSDDVYISIAGTTGMVGMVPQDLDGANLTENAAKLVIKNTDQIRPLFLMYALASAKGQREIRRRTTKTSQPKLALMRIKQFQFRCHHRMRRSESLPDCRQPARR